MTEINVSQICKIFNSSCFIKEFVGDDQLIIPPVYEVYRGYIVFAFSVCVFVCLCVCKLFFRQRFLRNYLT